MDYDEAVRKDWYDCSYTGDTTLNLSVENVRFNENLLRQAEAKYDQRLTTSRGRGKSGASWSGGQGQHYHKVVSKGGDGKGFSYGGSSGSWGGVSGSWKRKMQDSVGSNKCRKDL